MVSRGGFFAFSFGSIVGSGWVVLLGEWLKLAAPGGALLALVAGGMLMAAIGLCYAELAARMPRAGGELRFALETLGDGVAFPVGWFLTLFLVAICAFEGTALPWFLSLLAPALKGRPLYYVLGEPVTSPGLILGCLGSLLMCGLNLSGVKMSTLFQRLVTFGFLAVMGGMILAGFLFGHLANLAPWFSPPGGRSWFLGFVWLFATCAMLLTGFQTALYLIEEREPWVSVQSATMFMVLGIIAAALFYAAVVLSAGSIMPWHRVLASELPSVAAFDALRPGGLIGPTVLIVAVCSLAKTWNATIMMSSRLIQAQANAGLLPASLGRLNPRRAPANALWLVTLASMVGVFLCRGALVPIVNMATICVSSIIVLMLVCLAVQRRRQPASPGFSVPWPRASLAVCLLGAVAMALFAIFQPLWVQRGVPLEWQLVAAWAALGLLFRFIVRRN